MTFLGFPDSSDGKESTCNVGDLGSKDPLEKGKATPLVFWPGEFHGVTESDMTEQL